LLSGLEKRASRRRHEKFFLELNPHEQGLCGVPDNYFQIFSKKIKKTLKFAKTPPLPAT